MHPTPPAATVLDEIATWAGVSTPPSKHLASRADAEDAIALLRESYDALRAPLASAARSQS